MKRIISGSLCFFVVMLLFTGCISSGSENNTADATSTPQQTDTPALELKGNTIMESVLIQMVEQGQMTEAEKQEMLSYMSGLDGGEADDPIRSAVDSGIIAKEQAQALHQILNGQASEGAQSPSQSQENTSLPTAPQNADGLSVIEANEIEEQLLAVVGYSARTGGYPIVDTGQTTFYSDNGEIAIQKPGDDYYGQDANYTGNQPSYTDNGDGTVTDNVTGLMWQQDPGDKMTWEEAVENLKDFELAGYNDWRLPTIKELYSLIQFTGVSSIDSDSSIPYINTDYFTFTYGDATGERVIDSQYATSTIYESDTMGGNATMFGVNFADGRIKGYPISKEFYVMYVRGNTSYGINSFVDNGDGTITDESTGMMWLKYDSGYFGAGDAGDGGMTWEQALEWAENLEFAGYDDWTLPDAKQLQSIVDYTRSPDTTGSAAIDPLFQATEITDIIGAVDYAFYWTSTTHLDGMPSGSHGVYISFGEALGQMNGTVMDVHGAGAQRSDPKTGDAEDYPFVNENAPQGDVQAVYNLVRVVRIAD